MMNRNVRLATCALALGLASALPVAAQTTGSTDTNTSAPAEREGRNWGWLGLLGLFGLTGLKRRRDEGTDVHRSRGAM